MKEGGQRSEDLLLSRIHDYLGNGGLFNPEMMEHEKVRDLIMACRDELQIFKNKFANRRITEDQLVNAVRNLVTLLGKSGTTADWPIDLVARDKEHADELCRRLNAVDEALLYYPHIK